MFCVQIDIFFAEAYNSSVPHDWSILNPFLLLDVYAQLVLFDMRRRSRYRSCIVCNRAVPSPTRFDTFPHLGLPSPKRQSAEYVYKVRSKSSTYWLCSIQNSTTRLTLKRPLVHMEVVFQSHQEAPRLFFIQFSAV
ncbi:MAG: hypothetical protein ACI8VT_002583 [Saprospiraceae bacterium]|jgi:hypothetical protein